MFRLNKFQIFYSPEDTGGGALGELTKGDILDELNIEDPPEEEEVLEIQPEKKAKPEKQEDDEEQEQEDEEIDELKELEKELSRTEDDDELDEKELVNPVKRSTILKKYPTLFKDFPQLERSYYRDQQFTEMYPTMKDAKLANDKAETLDRFEQKINSGDLTDVLSAVKKQDEKSFHKLVDNYMGALSRVDSEAYSHVIGNLIKHTIINLNRAAQSQKDEEGNPHPGLMQTAHILHQFVFGSGQWENPKSLYKEDPGQKAEEAVNNERSKFVQQKFEHARDGLSTRITNSIKSTITRYIDPKNTMTEYVRNAAINDAYSNLNRLMGRDTRLNSILEKLWEGSFSADFSPDSLDKIRSAYLSRATSMLAPIIKKARNEALKGLGKRVNNESSSEDEDETPDDSSTNPKKKRMRDSKPPTKRGQTDRDRARSIPKDVSTLDYLNSD